jgi:hypothetical protein
MLIDRPDMPACTRLGRNAVKDRVKPEINVSFDELYPLRFARLQAGMSGLKGSAAHPANRGTLLKEPPHCAASAPDH